MGKRSAEPRYHHGNLRRALLDATLALVAERGVASLSMRELSRRVGVSTAAPYNHFADKASLLAALGEESLTMLDDVLAGAWGAPARARESKAARDERVFAVLSAHLAFATRESLRYALLFVPDVADRERHPGFFARAEAVQARLLAIATEVLPDGNKRERLSLGLLWWSTVHGLAASLGAGLEARRPGHPGGAPLVEAVLRRAASAR